jgi:hypothetical protein
MLKNLAPALGLLAGLSACAAPYGYPGYGYYAPPSVLSLCDSWARSPS